MYNANAVQMIFLSDYIGRYFTRKIHWKLENNFKDTREKGLYYICDANALDVILLWGRIANNCIAGMQWKWFYDKNALTIILREEFTINYLMMRIHYKWDCYRDGVEVSFLHGCIEKDFTITNYWNHSIIAMHYKWFYNRNTIEMILRWKCLGKFSLYI